MNLKAPSLRTNRLLLRNISDLDLNNIYKGLSNPAVIKHYGISFSSLEETKTQMLWFAQKEQLWWAICALDNTVFYGAGGLNTIDYTTKSAEIGLWLLPEFWGKGIMKEALPLIADYGLNQLKLNRIEGFVDTGNINCKRAMEHLDFKHESTIDNYEIKDGKAVSVAVYAKTYG